MKVLNLVNKEESDIQYDVSKFPDGQQSVTILNSVKGTTLYTLLNHNTDIQIKSRLNDFRDLELIICANAALRNLGLTNVHLYTPYFIGGRSDRKFSEGGVNYLKDVVAPIINSQGFKSVTVLDPHSDVIEATIKNIKKENNLKLVKWALTKIDNTNQARERVTLVSPDAGALKKVFDVAQEFEINKLIIASKHRDIKTGKITHTEVPNLENYNEDNKFVIVDDICDGGRTFIELSKVIKEKLPNAKIYLIVTHGIFSAGLKPFKGYFDKIYTTNSYRTITSMDEWGAHNEKNLHLVEQHNIF